MSSLDTEEMVLEYRDLLTGAPIESTKGRENVLLCVEDFNGLPIKLGNVVDPYGTST